MFVPEMRPCVHSAQARTMIDGGVRERKVGGERQALLSMFPPLFLELIAVHIYTLFLCCSLQ